MPKICVLPKNLMHLICHLGVTKGGRRARLGLVSLDQDFLITDLLEPHILLAGLGAVNHTWTVAGVAMTLPRPSLTASYYHSSRLQLMRHPSCLRVIQNSLLSVKTLTQFEPDKKYK